MLKFLKRTASTQDAVPEVTAPAADNPVRAARSDLIDRIGAFLTGDPDDEYDPPLEPGRVPSGYYANRYAGKCSTTTPFVLATGCGDPQTSGNGLAVANAQLAMNDALKYPDFAGNVKTMGRIGGKAILYFECFKSG